MNSKVFQSASEALAGISDGVSIMSGGFGLCGIPENSIQEIRELGIKNLTAISNNIGNSGRGLAHLLKKRQISKAICSYVGGNRDLEEQMLSGAIEVELVPQGTFSERIRAAGMGIRGFYTPTGCGTPIAEGKEEKCFDKPCVLELPLNADWAFIKAEMADPYGNAWFKESARGFSPLMAMAGKVTVLEVEKLVSFGEIPPENVHLPGIFVQRIFQGRDYENAVEFHITEDH